MRTNTKMLSTLSDFSTRYPVKNSTAACGPREKWTYTANNNESPIHAALSTSAVFSVIGFAVRWNTPRSSTSATTITIPNTIHTCIGVPSIAAQCNGSSLRRVGEDATAILNRSVGARHAVPATPPATRQLTLTHSHAAPAPLPAQRQLFATAASDRARCTHRSLSVFISVHLWFHKVFPQPMPRTLRTR